MDLGTIEYYNSYINQFEYTQVGKVRFEYSLKAVYEWESRWKKPFLKGDHNDEEIKDFYRCMALDPIPDEALTTNVMELISRYIEDDNTATTFSSPQTGQNGNKTPTRKIHTAEEIYALMVMAGIPLEFENRNLNRLLVILRIISIKNSPPTKMTKEEIYKQNRELNRQRRAKLKTKG